MTLGEVFNLLVSVALVLYVVVLIGAFAGYQPAKDFLSSGGPSYTGPSYCDEHICR